MSKSERAERIGLEPGAVMDNGGNRDAFESEIEHSKAISLKRIADAICGDDRNSGIFHAIFDIASRSAP